MVTIGISILLQLLIVLFKHLVLPGFPKIQSHLTFSLTQHIYVYPDGSNEVHLRSPGIFELKRTTKIVEL